jgi:membrane peptidoglycan carboxypeptidase
MDGWWGRVGRTAAWSLGALAVGGFSGLLGVLAVVYAMVWFGDDSNLKKSTIMARINEETNIYMLDEEAQIGSIFESSHRRYVPIDEVPAHMINAIIAAEDKNFYDHHGIDPVAMFSAGVGFLKGGRMRGASTLTQQTVRNIMGWWELSAARKIKEMIGALQIERLYDKRQILEFYLNQFYVSGNGNGIGVAAKYYFNKEVRDLDLVEAAFIAGSVKGPSAYDPFIKYTKELRERAIKNAYHRKNYVIRRMYEQGWITEEQFKEAWEMPVKFNRGKFRSEEVTLVHLIRQQLEKPEILEALGIDDPRQIATAGLKIFSTIDGDMQSAGQLAVRRNLSRLETILKGFKAEEPDAFKKLRSLTVNDFYAGQVSGFGGTDKAPTVQINFGLPECEIPYESLMRYAKWVDLPWSQGWERQLKEMLKVIKPGDALYVEVKEYDPDSHKGVCELMKRPRVNGGLIALDKGEVRAVVSGFDTKGFNRAVQAKRQPGSVFKPVVYFAALQLGWSILDRLDNERQVFPFQGRFYYPRPDHDSPYKETSMLWAGITSENCASVALTARLVEKLNFEQFKQLMGVMELLPRPGEAPRDFHYRVARELGVTLDNDGVKEFQLTNALNDLLLDVSFNTSYDFQQRLKKMWWGRGYAAEMQQIVLADDDLSPSQKAAKLKLAGNNFLRLSGMATQLAADWQAIEAAVAAKGVEAAVTDTEIMGILERFRVLPGAGKPALGYVVALEGEKPGKDYKNRQDIEALTRPIGRPLNGLDAQAIWGGNALFGSADLTLADVMLDGWMPQGYFAQLGPYVEKHYEEIMGRGDDYDLPRYWQHHDFRVAIGLNYLVALARAMGVTSPLEPVLSFPLGTNVVSLAEVAKIYQTFVSGKTYKFYQDGPPNQINFIRRIEDRNGNKLYEPERVETQLVTKEFGLQMREILQRVVTHGTGRQARAELYLTVGPDGQPIEPNKDPKAKPDPKEKRIRIPAFGKTGTTNDYINANFAGFMPYPTAKGEPLDPENSYVLAAYSGYDLNKKMQNGGIIVTGAVGALPAWIGLAKEIITTKKYADMLDPLDLNVVAKGEWPVKVDERARGVMADMARGVVLGGGGGDQEAVALTDVAREGESRFDEFRANVVEATLRIPVDPDGSPLRVFAPYKVDAAGAKMPAPTRVELKPSPLQISQKGAPLPKGTANGATPTGTAPKNPDERTYDEDGQREGGEDPEIDGELRGIEPVGGEGTDGAMESGAAPSPTSTATGAAPIDPMEILKDVGDPAEKTTDEPPGDDAGFVEGELW